MDFVRSYFGTHEPLTSWTLFSSLFFQINPYFSKTMFGFHEIFLTIQNTFSCRKKRRFLGKSWIEFFSFYIYNFLLCKCFILFESPTICIHPISKRIVNFEPFIYLEIAQTKLRYALATHSGNFCLKLSKKYLEILIYKSVELEAIASLNYFFQPKFGLDFSIGAYFNLSEGKKTT